MHQGIYQLKQIIGGFQDELASLLWDNTPQARDREKVLVRAIVAHMQAVEELESRSSTMLFGKMNALEGIK